MPYLLTPFRYCEYKETDSNRELLDCGTLAGAKLGGMSFCNRHHLIMEQGLEEGKVTLVRDSDMSDTIKSSYDEEKALER